MTGTSEETNDEQLFRSADSDEAKALRRWMMRMTEHLNQSKDLDDEELRRLRQWCRQATGWDPEWRMDQ